MPTHRTAMRILYNRDTLHHFPPPDRRWKWGDVVGKSEGKVDPSEAHVVSAYLQRHDDDDGRYSVDRRLAEYLDDQHSITLDGSVTDPQQQTLPVDTGPERESRVLAADLDPRRERTGAGSRQLSLSGEDVTDDVRLAGAAETMRERDRVSDLNWDGRAGRAVTDARQGRLTAFTHTGVFGALREQTGEVYSGPSPRALSQEVP